MQPIPDASLASPLPPIPRYERVAAWVLVVIYAVIGIGFVSGVPNVRSTFFAWIIAEIPRLFLRVWRTHAFLPADYGAALSGVLFGLLVGGLFLSTQMLARGLGRRGLFAGRGLWWWVMAHLSICAIWLIAFWAFVTELDGTFRMSSKRLVLLAASAVSLLTVAYVLWRSRSARLGDGSSPP